MMYGRKKPRSIAPIVLIGFFLYSLNPGSLGAQDSESIDLCDSFVQTADALLRNADSTDPEVLQAMAITAEQGRLCYGEKRKARVIWLLNREVWALDQLKRYEEAEARVNIFYNQYANAAVEEYRARFALHRLRFRSLSGDFIGAVIAYEKAQQNSNVLPLDLQINLLLDGAYLYTQIQLFSSALSISEQAQELARGFDDDSVLQSAYARALSMKGEVVLAMEKRREAPDSLVLARSIRDLDKARSIFQARGISVRYLEATVTLARVHAALGNIEQAYAHFDEALTQAQARGDTRTRILAHLRRGSLHLEQGRLGEAEDDFNGGLALTDSSGIREFELSLLLGLAEAQEARHDLADARRIYRRVIDADLAGVSAAEVREAKERAQAALLRVMEQAEQRSLPAFWFWAAVSFSLTLVGYLVYTRRRRRRGAGQAGISLHTLLDPQGLLILDGESPLLQQRLDCIAQVLRDPAAMLAKLEDPVFRAEVERQGVINNTMLFNCAAVLEEQATGQTFENDPANTLGRYLRQEFRVRHIPWPQTPDAWRWMLGTDKKSS